MNDHIVYTRSLESNIRIHRFPLIYGVLPEQREEFTENKVIELIIKKQVEDITEYIKKNIHIEIEETSGGGIKYGSELLLGIIVENEEKEDE